MKKYLIILLLGIGTFVWADDLPRFYGEEVVVTGTRLPEPVSQSPWNTTVIGATELKSYRTVGEALRLTAGIDAQSFGGPGALTSIRLRGANASQVLILVDGKRLNSPTLGMTDLGDLLTDNVERIEVVRAPLSALYGSDAVSGAINVITKKPRELTKTLVLGAGDYGQQTCRLAIGNEYYSLAYSNVKSAGCRRNSDYAAGDFTGRINWPTPLGEIFADYNFYDALKGVPGVPTSESDPSSASEPNDRQSDRNTRISAGLKGDSYSLQLYQNTMDQNLNPYIFGASRTQTWRNGLDWQQAFDLIAGKMSYGLEVREDRGTGTMSGDHTIHNYAVYLQDQLVLSERYSLDIGARVDRHSTAGTVVSPRAGIVYQPNEGLILRLAGGTAFRTPTLNELYWDDGWMHGDTALKPEKSTGYEVALEKILSSNSSAKVSYYQANVTDLILWDWQSSTIETRAKNVGQVRQEGVEFEFVRRLGESGKAFINYSYQKAVDEQDFDPLAIGKTIRYTPLTKYNVGLILAGSSLLIRHVGERYADQYNLVRLPAYTVVDLRLAKQFRNITLDLSVTNLLDERYSEAVGNDPTTFAYRNYPMPGRQYTFKVQWGF